MLRTYHSFTQAADENGLSRILVGFHFRTAVTVGIEHGRAIADPRCQSTSCSRALTAPGARAGMPLEGGVPAPARHGAWRTTSAASSALVCTPSFLNTCARWVFTVPAHRAGRRSPGW